jgi:hypothetical protein
MSETESLTDEQLDWLERRYTPAEDQKCVVCGAPLRFSHSESGEKAVYNCSSDAVSPLRSTLPLRERIEHYRRSAWYDQGEASVVVVAVRELRQWREHAKGREKAAVRDELDDIAADIALRMKNAARADALAIVAAFRQRNEAR